MPIQRPGNYVGAGPRHATRAERDESSPGAVLITLIVSRNIDHSQTDLWELGIEKRS